IGLVGQRAGDGHALLLAAGNLRREFFALVPQSGQVQQTVDDLPALLLLPLPDAQAEADVFGHGHSREERVILEDHADVAITRAQVFDALAAKKYLAAVRRLQTGDQPQRGALAAAGRA